MHYNPKGHRFCDLMALIIERVILNDVSWLLEREDLWIKRLETKNPHGWNKNVYLINTHKHLPCKIILSSLCPVNNNMWYFSLSYHS